MPSIRNGSAIRILDLGPTGQSGSNQMAMFVKRYLLGKLFDEMRSFRTRPHKFHFPLQDVPELRYFVDPYFSDHSPNKCYSIVIGFRPNRLPSGLSVGLHGTKLYHLEASAVFSDTFLFVKNGTLRFQFDQ